MNKNIAVLAGDGIGPEVMECAIEVLDAIAQKYNHTFNYTYALVGGAAYDKYKDHCPAKTIEICKNSDAILFGSVGGPVEAQNEEKWQGCEAKSILALRKTFNFNVNIRPAKVFESLKDSCPLKDERIKNGADIEIFRELSRDIYFGEHKRFIDSNGVRQATDLAEYDEETIRNIAIKAFKRAQERSKVLTSVDKANVLDTSRLWRDVVNEVAKDFPDVKVNHMYVDNCAMQLVLNPGQFDVLVTGNIFGDILSDLASVLPGSIGLVPSISLNADGFGLYEPSGGSAYDIKGLGKANPIAQILSAALMLAYSFDLVEESQAIEKAVEKTLEQGYRTADIYSKDMKLTTTKEFTSKIISFI
ncbi:3-isopropylmalate dehydrogenase [Francisella frigiditurris]|uniref:3-isopropylmalate dehydrogenase n=1 Tax=Francisella frigiditurris TaxID=1542390 RepID=A0A1J0KS04_9GAMM|nr:3-isopropylmalate dehydrogenase [Francisella frigiditurris]APC96474.1 3-isopropylmalate dehydrogenase [Francisella frigiditurris]